MQERQKQVRLQSVFVCPLLCTAWRRLRELFCRRRSKVLLRAVRDVVGSRRGWMSCADNPLYLHPVFTIFINMSTKKKPPTHGGARPLPPPSASAAAAPVASVAATPVQSHATHAASLLAGTPGPAMLNPFAAGIGSVSCQSLYWHNLLLLGFDVQAQSQAHRIELYPNMFDKPHARAMQMLLHFLLLAIKACPASEAHNAAPEWKDIAAVS